MPAHFLQSVHEKAVNVFHWRCFFTLMEKEANTFRLGFWRLKEEEIVRGSKIIGDTLKK